VGGGGSGLVARPLGIPRGRGILTNHPLRGGWTSSPRPGKRFMGQG